MKANRGMRKRGRWLAAFAALAMLALAVFAGLAESGTRSPAAAQYKPINSAPPSISGTAQVDSTLKTTNGTWQGGVQNYSYQWQICDKNGNGCKNIAGADGSSYRIVSGDVGNRIRVTVTAHNADGKTSATSAPTNVVTAASSGGGGGNGTCQGSGPVSIKDIAPPIRLLVDKWQFNPGTVNRSTQTISARIHISDTCNRSVGGALVWATAIPYNQVSTEQGTTGSDGYVTLTLKVESGFPANPGRQQIMAMLVRSNDPNGSVLAGVSTRRVLNLPVNVS